MEAMAAGKVPVVIPRYAKFGEHVNDHQGDFVQLVAARLGGIVPVYDITNLSAAVEESSIRLIKIMMDSLVIPLISVMSCLS